jgi:putative phosphoribosyl transferase
MSEAPALEQEVHINLERTVLAGNLTIPPGARGLVLFAHGSGSSRHSPRNRYVAQELEAAGLGTLLMDLLTVQEEAVDSLTRELRFDIPLLARRLVGTLDWLGRFDSTRELQHGIFGASTGAAAALVAAAECPEQVKAVVSRGGRPDLATTYLPFVQAPTLLIVGGADPVVVDLNLDAYRQLRAIRDIRIIPGATHLFEEPGALENVSRLAAAWFNRHLGRGVAKP